MNANTEGQIREKFAPVVDEFKRNPSVLALVFAGSTTSGLNDAFSDEDLYVYSHGEVDVAWRRELAVKFSTRHEIDQHFYENADDWLLTDSHQLVELIYRSVEWIEEQVDRIWIRGEAALGYSTCLVHNVKHSVILHDPEQWFRKLQSKTESPYPELLKENILKKNLPMLSGKLNGSFDEQIRTAIQRNDVISIHHRVSAFVASYFDILFAINGLTHPGEKRLVPYACEHCRILPASFPQGIEKLCAGSNAEKPSLLSELVNELRDKI